MRTALAPADAQEEEEEEACQADHDHKEPICKERRGCELGDMDTAPRLHSARQSQLWGQGTICKAPQRTCNCYSLVLCAQD